MVFGPSRVTHPNIYSSLFTKTVEKKNNTNGILIRLSVFAGLMNVTNRQTGTQTDNATPSVAIGHI